MKKISTRNALFLFLIVCTVLYSSVIEAQQKIYFTDSFTGKVQRSGLNGNNVEDLVITGLSNPQGIALDLTNGKMYFTDWSAAKVQRADLDGSNVENLVATSGSPRGIALDLTNGKMYWAGSGIRRADLDGNNVEDLSPTGGNPWGIALDIANGKMYWASFADGFATGKIQRSDLDGNNVEDLVITGLGGPFGIALDLTNGKMYFTDLITKKIHRADLDGSNVEDILTGIVAPNGIALDVTNGKMYWADNLSRIQRADLDGGNIEVVVPTGVTFPDFIALDLSDVSLPVELSIFTAVPHTNGVHLRWRTESETNNLGFHIYRSQKAGEYVRITPTLISGHGSTTAAHDYSFVDETANEAQSYWYLIEDIDFSGITERSDPIQVVFSRKAISLKLLPTHFALYQNYPNPFNPETWIPYQLAADTEVTITIYSSFGHHIRTLELGTQPANSYLVKDKAAYWDGRSHIGERVSSGIYYYHLRAGELVATKKMIVLK